TPADAPENARFLVVPIWRDEGKDRHANHFLGSIAKETLGPLVPTRDNAVEVFADDGVVKTLDDGGEKPGGAQPRDRSVTTVGSKDRCIDRSFGEQCAHEVTFRAAGNSLSFHNA